MSHLRKRKMISHLDDAGRIVIGNVIKDAKRGGGDKSGTDKSQEEERGHRL